MSWPPSFGEVTDNAQPDAPFFPIDMQYLLVSAEYSQGVSTETTSDPVDFQGDIQPATLRDYTYLTATLEQPIRLDETFRLYTASDLVLPIYDQQQQTAGAKVLYNGETFRVMRRAIWGNTLLPYNKYYLIREIEE